MLMGKIFALFLFFFLSRARSGKIENKLKCEIGKNTSRT
jgi:hypothetical protein